MINSPFPEKCKLCSCVTSTIFNLVGTNAAICESCASAISQQAQSPGIYDKAWYQRNFSLGEFIYETIGLGRSLAIGETQLDAIKAIEKDIVDLHLEKNKEMYEQRGTSIKITSPAEEFPDDYPRSGVSGLGLKKNRTTVTKMEAVKFPPTEAIITQYNNAVKNNNTVIINSLELVYDIPETIKQKA